MHVENNKKAILVVDDSDIIRQLLKSFFEEYDFEVVTCFNGLEGIQKAVEYKPKLIFLDLMMPNFDGIKMLQVLKVLEDLKHIPVIVISGNTNRSNVLTALEAGADRVISKPLQKEVIIRNINEMLGKKFLAKPDSNKALSNKSKEEIVSQLKNFFIKSFPAKKKAIVQALISKNKELLKNVFHELKGEGGTIGYPKLSAVSQELENKLLTPSVDWHEMNHKCNEIFLIVEEIRKSILNVE